GQSRQARRNALSRGAPYPAVWAPTSVPVCHSNLARRRSRHGTQLVLLVLERIPKHSRFLQAISASDTSSLGFEPRNFLSTGFRIEFSSRIQAPWPFCAAIL